MGVRILSKRKRGMLLGAKSVKNVPLWYKFKLTSPRDADTARALFLEVCYVPAVCEPFGFVPSDCDIKINTIREGWCLFLWRRKRDSNPRGFGPNGFQVFYSVPNIADFERLYRKMKDTRKVRRGKALRRF